MGVYASACMFTHVCAVCVCVYMCAMVLHIGQQSSLLSGHYRISGTFGGDFNLEA